MDITQRIQWKSKITKYFFTTGSMQETKEILC